MHQLPLLLKIQLLHAVTETEIETAYGRPNRSFVIREGRFTPAQRKAFEQYWPAYGIDTDELQALDLQQYFSVQQPLVLDIGFGAGDSLLSLAKQRPDLNFVGVEVYRPGIGAVMQRLHQQEINNVRLINADVVPLLEDCIATASITGVLVWFPDPWPKKRHHKRRLIRSNFLDQVQRILQPEGVLHLASDWQPYVVDMQEQLAAYPELKPFTSAPHPLAISRPDTRFQQRGLRLGHELSDLIYLR